jgi:RNA polymerase sigma-70 factor, ECF subfamily
VGATAVAETDRTALRNLLLADYGDLSRRLTRRLGSSEFACDALQETFLRLERTEIGQIARPKAYLFRIAVNIATDRRRAESRRLTATEVDSLLEVVDDSPDPAQTVEARSELEALKRAVAELPPRRREIFLASRVNEIPHRDIAKRFGVTVRTIELELKQALEHCAERLKRSSRDDFAPRSRRSSSD